MSRYMYINKEYYRSEGVPFAVLHLDDREHDYVMQASDRALGAALALHWLDERCIPNI
jgi:hypothetical protein